MVSLGLNGSKMTAYLLWCSFSAPLPLLWCWIGELHAFGAINVKIRSSFLYMHKKLYFCSMNIKR